MASNQDVVGDDKSSNLSNLSNLANLSKWQIALLLGVGVGVGAAYYLYRRSQSSKSSQSQHADIQPIVSDESVDEPDLTTMVIVKGYFIALINL